MEITFFGTSHGYSDNGKFLSSALLEAGGVSYLIDAGAPVESLMLKYGKNSDDMRGIFITHMHNDHVVSLPSVIEQFLRFRYNDKVKCFLPEEEGLKAYLAWEKALHMDVEKIQKTVKFYVVKEGVIYEENGLKVTAMPTNHLGHGKYPAFSYMFEYDGKRVLFTGDMDARFPEYESIVGDREYDLVVCEKAHAGFFEVWEKLAKTKTKKMIINHTWAPCMGDYLPLFEKMPFEIELAYDGQKVEL